MRDRMQELWDGAVPVGVPCPQADPAAVKRRVNAALNAVPSERRAYMRQKLRFAAAAAAIAALLAGSALAGILVAALRRSGALGAMTASLEASR